MKIEKKPLSETGFIRVPAILELIPIGKSTLWLWVKQGKFPRPFKLGQRTTAWRVEDVNLFISSFNKR
jgi:predicted DNA-binding transcriptional regulator AlpA